MPADNQIKVKCDLCGKPFPHLLLVRNGDGTINQVCPKCYKEYIEKEDGQGK